MKYAVIIMILCVSCSNPREEKMKKCMKTMTHEQCTKVLEKNLGDGHGHTHY